MTIRNKINQINLSKRLVGLFALLLAISFQANAAQDGYIKLTSQVQKMVIVDKGNGEKSYEFEPAAKVLPNEVVQYNTYFENISNKPADNVQIINKIPEHTVYLENSAQGKSTDIVFSVDGGKHYEKEDLLEVVGQNGERRAAKPSDYTHIRWQYKKSLSPSEEQAIAFRVRLL